MVIEGITFTQYASLPSGFSSCLILSILLKSIFNSETISGSFISISVVSSILVNINLDNNDEFLSLSLFCETFGKFDRNNFYKRLFLTKKMKKMMLMFLLAFLVFGIALHSPLVVAEDNDSNSNRSGTSVDAGVSGSVDTDEDSDEDNDEDNETEDDEDKNKTEDIEDEEKETKDKEADCEIKIERKVKIENGKRVEEIKKKVECKDGRKEELQLTLENRTENGKVRERIKYQFEGEDREVETEEGIDLEEESNSTHYKLKARLRNGNETEIKIMPDRASQIAIDRLKALNFTVVLKEVSDRNVPRVVYNIETNKDGKFIGVFKLKMKVEGQIDPTTGEFLGTSKPWWAFLVSGEDSDQTSVEGNESTTDTSDTGLTLNDSNGTLTVNESDIAA